MGAFIIMSAAINAHRRRMDEERKEREKKIADGYEEETYLSNPTMCYKHFFENPTHKSTASLFNWVGIFILLISAGLAFFVTPWFAISAIIAIVLFFKADSIKSSAYEFCYSDSKKTPDFHSGWKHTGYNYEPHYSTRWVKRK